MLTPGGVSHVLVSLLQGNPRARMQDIVWLLIQVVGVACLHVHLYYFPQMNAVPPGNVFAEKLLYACSATLVGLIFSENFNQEPEARRLFPPLRLLAGAGCINATANITCSPALAVDHRRLVCPGEKGGWDVSGHTRIPGDSRAYGAVNRSACMVTCVVVVHVPASVS